MTAKEITVRAEFENLGFQETDTGGGCTAWVMGLSHGRECLVTNGDLEAPLDMDSPAVLSVMHEGCWESVYEMPFSNTRTLLEWFDAFCAGGGTAGQAIERVTADFVAWVAGGGQ